MFDAYIAIFAVTIVMPIVVSVLLLIGKFTASDDQAGKRPTIMRRAG